MPDFLADVLSRPEQREFLTTVKAAVNSGQKPSYLLFEHGAFGKEIRREFDSRILIAYQILQDETCPSCGVPIWYGHNEDREIAFEVLQSTCFSCADLERARDDSRKQSEGREHTRYGITEYVRPYKDGGTDAYGKPQERLPLDSREDSFKAMALRAAALEAVTEGVQS